MYCESGTLDVKKVIKCLNGYIITRDKNKDHDKEMTSATTPLDSVHTLGTD